MNPSGNGSSTVTVPMPTVLSDQLDPAAFVNDSASLVVHCCENPKLSSLTFGRIPGAAFAPALTPVVLVDVRVRP